MNILTIRQKIESIDYAYNKPISYLVFIPGLSLIIQKIKLANLIPLVEQNYRQAFNSHKANLCLKKFSTTFKWHLRGSLFQLSISIFAFKVLAISNTLIISLIFMSALYSTLNLVALNQKHHHKMKIYDLDANGNKKSFKTEFLLDVFK